MTSTGELERLIQPSDLRRHDGRHSRAGRTGRRRGWFGTLSDAVVAAISALVR